MNCQVLDCACPSYLAHQWIKNQCRTCKHTSQEHEAPTTNTTNSDPSSSLSTLNTNQSTNLNANTFRPPQPKRATAPVGSIAAAIRMNSNGTVSTTTLNTPSNLTATKDSPESSLLLPSSEDGTESTVIGSLPASLTNTPTSRSTSSASRSSATSITAASRSPLQGPFRRPDLSRIPSGSLTGGELEPPARQPPPVPTTGRSERTSSQVGRPTSDTSTSPSPPAIVDQSLQKRYETECNKRYALEQQIEAISRQIQIERKEQDVIQTRLQTSEQTLQTQQQTLDEQAQTIETLRQEVAELTHDKAILTAKVMALEGQLETMIITPLRSNTVVTNTSSSSTSSMTHLDPLSLEARCRELERLWQKERAEREALEIQLEAREIHEQKRHGSITAFDVATGATIIDNRPRSAIPSPMSETVFQKPPAVPSPHSPYTKHNVQRTIPDDLIGFELADATIRLKDPPPPQASVSVLVTSSGSSKPLNQPQHHASATMAALPSSSPRMVPAVAHTPSSCPSSPVAALAASPAPSPSLTGTTIEIHELDVSKILAAFTEKYHWTHSKHRAYFRKEIEEILDDAHDEEIVRRNLKQLELQQIQPLQYELLSKLGEGGFGSVYKAHKISSGPIPASAPVAIKILNLEETRDVDQITVEISAINSGNSCEQLTHYYESFVLGTKLWLVQEFVDGGSVLDYLKHLKEQKEMTLMNTTSSTKAYLSAAVTEAGGLDEKYIAIIVREVLLGLIFLETQKKLHRDIKCANILLSRSTGAVKLADFGASRQLTDTMTKCNTFVGSPYWMAPEIMQQEEYNGKADIWSLGISCLEMATGQPPHYGVNPLTVMRRVMKQPPPILEGERYTRTFKEFVSLCCVKEPDLRPSLITLLKHPFIKKAKKTSVIKEMFTGSK